jgi:hypothetical protein
VPAAAENLPLLSTLVLVSSFVSSRVVPRLVQAESVRFVLKDLWLLVRRRRAERALVGGWLCDRMDRKTAYAIYGVLRAACVMAMAVAPLVDGWAPGALRLGGNAGNGSGLLLAGACAVARRALGGATGTRCFSGRFG